MSSLLHGTVDKMPSEIHRLPTMSFYTPLSLVIALYWYRIDFMSVSIGVGVTGLPALFIDHHIANINNLRIVCEF